VKSGQSLLLRRNLRSGLDLHMRALHREAERQASKSPRSPARSSVLSKVTDDTEDATAEGALNVFSRRTAGLREELVQAVGEAVDSLPVDLQHRLKLTNLTLLAMHGGRRKAATRFGIAGPVLSMLGHLSSERGDVTTARKADAAARPLTSQEIRWLEAAVLAIIRRVGEVAAAGSAVTLTQLTMADLPPL
jgi:hypothetical protein